MLFLQGLTFK